MENAKGFVYKKRTTFAKDYVGWQIYAAIQLVSSTLPLMVTYWVADIIGECLYVFARGDRRKIYNNLRVALRLKEPTLTVYARRIFRNFCRNIVDFLRFSKYDEEWFERYVEVAGKEHVEKALSLQKGVIIISGHLGSCEIAALAIRFCGFTINGIWASHEDPRLEKYFVEPRLKKGIKVILTGGALAQSLKALAANELVAFVIDHSYSGKGVEVDFFGRKAIIPQGMAIAALGSGAPIIPVAAVHLPHYRYRMIFREPIGYSLSGDREKDTREILSSGIKAIERLIREYQDQWVLFKKYYL